MTIQDKAAFEAKKVAWMEKEGFDKEGITYIVTGDTYSIKDQLKADGWKYNRDLMWHKADPAGYEDKVIEVKVEDVVQFTAWGEGRYVAEATKQIREALNKNRQTTVANSEWLEGDTVKEMPATLTKKGSFYGRFGLTYIYTFQTEQDNVLCWFTTKNILFDVGTKVIVSGRIKDRNEYQGTKQTVLTRCSVIVVEQ